jgi:hypothetical protein
MSDRFILPHIGAVYVNTELDPEILSYIAHLPSFCTHKLELLNA